MPAASALKVFGALSTSCAVSVPAAEGVPGMALPTPPASTTVADVLPPTMAASLVPLIVTLTVCVVPSIDATTKLSTTCCRPFRPCTAAFVSVSV